MWSFRPRTEVDSPDDKRQGVASFSTSRSLARLRPASLFLQASVVQTLDSAIHRINHYPADKYYGNQLRHPVDRFLSGG